MCADTNAFIECKPQVTHGMSRWMDHRKQLKQLPTADSDFHFQGDSTEILV